MDDFGTIEQTGWVYRATLILATSLAVLRQHGRTVPMDGICVEYGPGGMWHGVFHRTGIFAQRFGGDTEWSMVGNVPSDGGDVLPFLIAYRSIIEDESRTALDRSNAVRGLLSDPAYARFVRKLPEDLPTEWIVDRLRSALNISGPAARSLVLHGHLEAGDVLKLSESELRAIPKVGPKTIAALRLAR